MSSPTGIITAVWHYWQQKFDPIAALVSNLSEQDRKIYEAVTDILHKSCERTPLKKDDEVPLTHFLIFKRVESWALIEDDLRAINSAHEVARITRGIAQLTPIEEWTAEQILYINRIREIDKCVRSTASTKTKQATLATQKAVEDQVENQYLRMLKKALIKIKAGFDQAAQTDYLMNNPDCAALIKRVRRRWDYLSVFSDPNWRHVTIDADNVRFLIASFKQGEELPIKVDGATKAIFAITENGLEGQTTGHIRAKKIKLADRAFIPIELETDSDADQMRIAGGAAGFNVDPNRHRPIIQAHEKGNNYHQQVNAKIKQKRDSLTEFANRADQVVNLAIASVNGKLQRGECAYTTIQREPVSFLSQIWVAQPRISETHTKITTLTKEQTYRFQLEPQKALPNR